jgi:hypothetical protein
MTLARRRLRRRAIVPILASMSEGDSRKPDPVDDLRKGFGLLFRAAKTTLEKLPTGQIEEAVLTGAREVGRALENVTQSVEEQFLGKHAKTDAPAEAKAEEPPKAEAPGEPKPDGDASGAPDDETKTRIG